MLNALLIVCLAALAPGTHRDSGARINGTVVDQTGHAVAGATVSLSAPGRDRLAVADGLGRFEVQGLSPGEYRLAVTHPQHRLVAFGLAVDGSPMALSISLPPR